MGLSCECDFDSYDYESWWIPSDKFITLVLPRRKKCTSCNSVIQLADTAMPFYHYRRPNSDIEESIYGDEVETAPTYMCESCGGLYMALEELGYCMSIYDSMKQCVIEHNENKEEPK